MAWLMTMRGFIVNGRWAREGINADVSFDSVDIGEQSDLDLFAVKFK